MPTVKKESKINPTSNNGNLKKVLIIVAVVVVLVALIALLLSMGRDNNEFSEKDKRAFLDHLTAVGAQDSGPELTEEERQAILNNLSSDDEPEETEPQLTEEERQAILNQFSNQ